jgi:hypothetical protein
MKGPMLLFQTTATQWLHTALDPYKERAPHHHVDMGSTPDDALLDAPSILLYFGTWTVQYHHVSIPARPRPSSCHLGMLEARHIWSHVHAQAQLVGHNAMHSHVYGKTRPLGRSRLGVNSPKQTGFSFAAATGHLVGHVCARWGHLKERYALHALARRQLVDGDACNQEKKGLPLEHAEASFEDGTHQHRDD